MRIQGSTNRLADSNAREGGPAGVRAPARIIPPSPFYPNLVSKFSISEMSYIARLIGH